MPKSSKHRFKKTLTFHQTTKFSANPIQVNEYVDSFELNIPSIEEEELLNINSINGDQFIVEKALSPHQII
ncbi:unnamed protein product [Brachionus calyciflorus]|uniref:Uncharacterized protein n=1 Tax=Brachionus calyciflorus TaxID=104777 RepID=A0A814J6S3_9BILA|nr:unnamed protein product [Brachionus calyciflorus]